jgi:transposase
MAKKAKKLQTSKGIELKIVNPNAAGIDIADSEMQVCVPADRDGDNNRRFGSFTRDLNEISGWLKACGIETVAMEATGVYWIPLFFKLQKDGFDVQLCNAREVKNISEKKTDESDAEWLLVLHSYGMLKPSFQPENAARQIRNLARHRGGLLKSASKEVQHMQKAMEQMNIKLTNVISDITGVSGLRIITAILKGERDAQTLSALADSRCKRSREEIALSLEGTWDADHLFELKQSYELYQIYQGMVEECDKEIENLLQGFVSRIDEDNVGLLRTKKRINKKNAVAFDVESYANAIWGVNAMAITGMSSGSLLQLIGELGADFTDKFDSPAKFCKWCNLVPNNKISGGKLISSRLPKRKNPVGQIFRLCANTVAKSNSPMGFYFRRIKSRAGHMSAIVATAHKMAEIFFIMVRDRVAYDEGRVGLDEETLLKRKIERTQRQLEALNAKLYATAS